MSNILDRRFKYTASYDTDIRKTIQREKKRLEAIREEHEKNEREAVAKLAGSINPKARVANG